MIEGNWMNKPSEQTVPTLVPDAVDPGKLMAMAMTSTEKGFASGAALANGLRAMNKELVEFWFGRCASCSQLIGQLASCRSANDVLPMQQQYVQDLVRAYAALMPRLMAVLGDTEPGSSESAAEKPAARHNHAA